MACPDSTSLVPVVARQFGDDTIPTVNARELHAFLEVGKVFAAWIKARIEQYDFVEGRDFVVVAGLSVPESESSKARQQRTLDYHMTLAMAKELSMVERNDKGKQARQYFIECERVALVSLSMQPNGESHMYCSDLSAERLRELLHYEPETGVFTWRVPRTMHTYPGDVAGWPDPKGYCLISVESQAYRAHRLAWLYMCGSWPPDQIDHRNHVKSDNRWDNLRLATNAENAQNRRRARSDSRSGVLGVCWDKRRNMWAAYLWARDKRVYSFHDTLESAVTARAEAVAKYHPFAPCAAK
jgi:phage anti-repressor protein